MKQFLQQCVDRDIELAGPNVKFKKVSTPFPDDKIARSQSSGGTLANRVQGTYESAL